METIRVTAARAAELLDNASKHLDEASVFLESATRARDEAHKKLERAQAWAAFGTLALIWAVVIALR